MLLNKCFEVDNNLEKYEKQIIDIFETVFITTWFKTQNEFVIVEDGQNIYVSIKWTEWSEWSDINASLQINGHNKAGGYKSNIHKGYRKRAEEVIEALKKRTNLQIKNVIFTGFSLGGAISQVCSYLYKKSVCYAFGSPRVSHIKQNLKNITVINLEMDSVQYLMSSKMHHLNKSYILKEDGALTNDQTYKSKLNKYIAYWLFPLALRYKVMSNNHSIKKYQEKLEKHCNTK